MGLTGAMGPPGDTGPVGPPGALVVTLPTVTFRAIKNNTQAGLGAGTTAVVTFPLEIFDLQDGVAANNYDPATSTFTAPLDGVYRFETPNIVLRETFTNNVILALVSNSGAPPIERWVAIPSPSGVGVPTFSWARFQAISSSPPARRCESRLRSRVLAASRSWRARHSPSRARWWPRPGCERPCDTKAAQREAMSADLALCHRRIEQSEKTTKRDEQ